MYAISPLRPNTGEFVGLHQRSSGVPPVSAGRRRSYFWAAIASVARFDRTRANEALSLPNPVAVEAAGLAGSTSNSPRPTISSRLVIVARAYASLTATIVYRGTSGRRTR